jgi:hypothetical protein
MPEHVRDLEWRVPFVGPSGEEWVTIQERTVLEDDGSEKHCAISAGQGDRMFEASGDTREEALLKLEKALPLGTFLRICHQCRFGMYHPLQGGKMWCLKDWPSVADDVNANGRYASGYDKGVGVAATDEFNRCRDFQRPLSVAGRPGATMRA